MEWPKDSNASLSPVAEAIRVVLRSIGQANRNADPGSKPFGVVSHLHQKDHDLGVKKNCKDYYIFSYKEDFNSLWGYENRPFQGIDEIATGNLARPYVSIIIWDGYPATGSTSRGIPIESWITPIDWAFIASLRIYSRAKSARPHAIASDMRNRLPDWRVLIIDLVSHLYSSSRSVSLFESNPAMIPWIRIYKPVSPSETTMARLALEEIEKIDTGAYARLRASERDDFSTLIEDAKRPERILGLNQCYDSMDALQSIWTSNIIAPGDRHQVANLIAPMVLFEGLKNQKCPTETAALEKTLSNPLIFALVEELKELRLLSVNDSTAKRRARSGALEAIRENLSSLGDYRISLIDDQHYLGYEDILRFVTAARQDQITSHTSASELFERLRNILTMPQPIRTPGWRTSMFDKTTILMFDLRLWHISDNNTGLLHSFYAYLKKAVELYIENILEDDADDEQRRKFLEDWQAVKKSVDSAAPQEDLIALTILPRLISIVDPFLPIILFSSSSQRQTLEAFNDYPSIITSFKKPMPTGYAAGLDPVEYLEDLAEAFGRAVELCKLRFIGETISSLERSTSIELHRLQCEGFMSPQDGSFDGTTVCHDLRTASRVLLQGNHRLGWAIPLQLVEKWYSTHTGRDFGVTKPMDGTLYNTIAKYRHKVFHWDTKFFYWEKKDDEVNELIAAWSNFLKLLRAVPQARVS